MNSHILFKIEHQTFIVAVAICLCGATINAANASSVDTLWYQQPSADWNAALPIGNGRLGAMVFGGMSEERLQLNENTLWSGGPYDPSNPEARAALPEARKLIFAGQFKEAEKLIESKMMGRPSGQMSYQTMGDLKLAFPGHEGASDYRRELDLDTAIAGVSYTVGGVRFSREAFASPVDQVIVVRLTADKPGRIHFIATMATPQQAAVTTEGGDTLVMNGRNSAKGGIEGALKFQTRVRVLAQGGTTTSGADSLTVVDADSVTLLIAAATSFRNFKDVSGDPVVLAKNAIDQADRKAFDKLRSDHVAQHQRLFRRVTLDVGTSDAAKLPTNERIAKLADGTDIQLAALYFQYGRYLLISSSRPGFMPANLQGLWNDSMTPPWDSKFTININTEMNYWPAEVGNLAECHEPLLDKIQQVSQPGRRTAEVNYGARGWVCHHNFDLWLATAPIDNARCGFWPVGGAWLCKHLWDHYEYQPDKTYLAKVYPVMKGAAEFFRDTLVEDPRDKLLVTCPSTSPERPNPTGTGLCAGSTMDMGILRDLFDNCIKASGILGIDADFRARLQDARKRLAPLRIGKHGQIEEWRDDWDINEHDNHVSHLYNLFPSSQITPTATPQLADAARVSLGMRGDGDSSWGKAWRVNLYARLGDGNHAHQILASLLKDRSAPNLFSLNGGLFQIDGNLGAVSGIAEMLLQSHDGTIHLLPALPPAWPTGSVKGLRARGGFEVDLAWTDAKLTAATIRSMTGTKCTLRYGARTIDISLQPGSAKSIDGNFK